MVGFLLPQILPGHRLWCYATNRSERFLTVDEFDIRHSPATKEVWLNVFLAREELDRLGISEQTALVETDLAGDFEIAAPRMGVKLDVLCFQQRSPYPYNTEPAEALARIVSSIKNKVWETARLTSPYRKPYLYRCPSRERHARLPQIASVYLLMFCLGSVTRYSPGYFEDLLESKFGPLISTFISESPMQFLYLMASDILGREVSKPAII